MLGSVRECLKGMRGDSGGWCDSYLLGTFHDKIYAVSDPGCSLACVGMIDKHLGSLVSCTHVLGNTTSWVCFMNTVGRFRCCCSFDSVRECLRGIWCDSGGWGR